MAMLRCERAPTPLDVKVVTVERERTPLLHFVIVGLFILILLILAFGVMVRP